MSDIQLEKPQSVATDDKPQKLTTTNRQKSAAYPTMPLADAINAVRQLKEKLGNGPYGREDIAKALGHSCLSGPASSKISACTQFGLLDRTGNTYSLSQLSNKILTPIDSFEHDMAVIEAVRHPQVYSKLITKFEGQALPQLLTNILTREYGISDKVAGHAANYFKKSLVTAGIFKNGVVLSSKLQEEAQSNENRILSEPAQCDSVEDNASFARAGSQEEITIEIPDTGIEVTFPEEYAFALATGVFKEGLEKIKEEASPSCETKGNDNE